MVQIRASIGRECPTAVAIAHVGEATLRRAILAVNRPEVDTIVQVGTNLSMLRSASSARRSRVSGISGTARAPSASAMALAMTGAGAACRPRPRPSRRAGSTATA
jgi:hypothetical protein